MRFGGSFGAQASQSNCVVACCASLVMSTSTGPGRPPLAMTNASRIVRATSPACVTTTLCLVMGMVMPVMSISWNASEPRTLLLTWPVMQTTGEESIMAVVCITGQVSSKVLGSDAFQEI